MHVQFSGMEEMYTHFDPDLSKVALDIEADDPQEDVPALEAEAFLKLEEVLNMAGFDAVPESHLEIARQEEGTSGLNVLLPPAGKLSTRLYFRQMQTEIVRPILPESSSSDRPS